MLITPLVGIDGLPPPAGFAVIIAIFAGCIVTTYVVRAIESDAIATVRRMTGLVLASNIVWIVPLGLGVIPYLFDHKPEADINEFVVGAFVAWSFQLLVVNGAFLSSTIKSLLASAIQPMATLPLVSFFIVRWSSSTALSVLLGLAVLAVTIAFLLKFKSFKTEGTGISSLNTFQSFLKTWVTHNPTDLEGYFSSYSKDEPVVTKTVLVTSSQRAAMVLPGVHPGPFYPVGSYDLSELIYQELRKSGLFPIVLHGVGGHERNLPTNELAKKYAATISDFVAGFDGKPSQGLKGPVKFQLGPTTVTTMGFGDEVIAFLTSAPYNTDDLSLSVIDEAVRISKESGADLLLVDAHNSIGGENTNQPEMNEDSWRKVFTGTRDSPQETFEVGVAHSSEIGFDHGSDISDGGLTVMVFKKGAGKHALITSDSNNAVKGLREKVEAGLGKENVSLLELCTSDTHKSAARGLTDRGYHALGEDTDQEALIAAIAKLEKLAESRLSRGSVTTITSRTTLPLIGEKSLKDFAALTKETLEFTRKYAWFACVWVSAVFFLAIFA